MFSKLCIRMLVVCYLFGSFGQNVFANSQLQPAATKMPTLIPPPPDFDAPAYILIDANSGYVLAEKNADQRLAPASLTKIMTLYLVAEAVSAGKAHFTDIINVSEEAWRAGFGGSRMFIQVGTNVSLQELINGIATASGNDATVAVSEHLAGSESAFVNLMNQTAQKLEMKNTNFTDSNGLPNNNHYSTARDLAILSKAWIANFPQYYQWFKERWINYNNIKQPNRNRLLWRDSSVDGIKTGHTADAGYCLVASAVRNNGMRLLSIILGAKSDEARTKYTEALLNYGFRFFETRKLFSANTKLTTTRVWLGKENNIELGLQNNLYITLPTGQHSSITAKVNIEHNLKAPINKGQTCGTLNIVSNGQTIVSRPLIALQDNPRVNFVFALYDYILMIFQKG